MRSKRIVSDVTGHVTRTTRTKNSKCGKQAYSSKTEAAHHAAVQSRQTGDDIEPYHCFQCHCYHIGHKPGTRNK